jgi:cytoskeletal protein CcmA (bactofilin family)
MEPDYARMSTFSFRARAKAGDVRSLPVSHLGHAITVNGVLDTDGELRIHGRVLGRINAERIVIAAGGSVEGDVVANDALIGGRLNGRVFALNVTLESSAEVTGRVFHNNITVARGARIDARMPWRPPSYFDTLDQLPETRE